MTGAKLLLSAMALTGVAAVPPVLGQLQIDLSPGALIGASVALGVGLVQWLANRAIRQGDEAIHRLKTHAQAVEVKLAVIEQRVSTLERERE